MLLTAGESMLDGVAPGSLVVVRDEEWLVTQVSQTRDGALITCQGLSELVTGTTAQFYEGLDEIVPFDPRDTKVVADSSPTTRRPASGSKPPCARPRCPSTTSSSRSPTRCCSIRSTTSAPR